MTFCLLPMYEWVHTMCTCPGLCSLNLNGSSRFGFIALYLLTFTWYTVGMTVSWSLPWEVHSFRRGTSGCSLRFPAPVFLLQAIKNWSRGRPGNEAKLMLVSSWKFPVFFACSADAECTHCNLIGRFNTGSARVYSSSHFRSWCI